VDLKVSYDAGTTWSAWIPFTSGEAVEIPRPDVGPAKVLVVIRDRVGIEADLGEQSIYVLQLDPPAIAPGEKVEWEIQTPGEVDVLSVDLVKADLLSVKVKAKPLTKGVFSIALDLAAPGGQRFVLGRYPALARKAGIKRYPLPVTGRYHLIVRRGSGSTAERALIRLSLRVRQDKANRSARGEITGTEIAFTAAAGSVLKAVLKGEGIRAIDVALTGPDGAVDLDLEEKTGKVKILPSTLGAGTGTYTIRLARSMTVKYRWRVKLPKKP
jgi:hypothetical protein